MTVPKGKTIWIGNREYKEGAALPDSYKLPEKKSSKPAYQQDKK